MEVPDLINADGNGCGTTAPAPLDAGLPHVVPITGFATQPNICLGASTVTTCQRLIESKCPNENACLLPSSSDAYLLSLVLKWSRQYRKLGARACSPPELIVGKIYCSTPVCQCSSSSSYKPGGREMDCFSAHVGSRPVVNQPKHCVNQLS